ncbi:MBL fold metallo-hydrolase [Meridianimarinicoccus aquatilis]|uniref:MBL fold metallo-hydrolase n=1 Tax=Meridianimarinicoccus aquatilis TaxID=2552766 RepID=A0A4R6B3A3_9RHOB|nr:MBL fold metallo-hydrolase [Fluviibacterium aquatile]TDL91277.1 MBL fold metallo-hydrolase [Fluviibacterium aquatile]
MQPNEFDPAPGRAEGIAPGLRRVVARNPGPMTGPGTNTYLLGWRGLAVIDPGPDDPAHLAAVLDAIGPEQRITHILVTHAHLDHSPLAKPLSDATGAPILAYGPASAGRSTIMVELAERGLTSGGEGVDTKFSPDHKLADGNVVTGDDWSITAHWTPGHMGNHMVFEWGDCVFSGDLVMGWSSSLVSPPDGDMTDFLASCEKLARLGPRILHPGHGAPVTAPAIRIAELIAHRKSREQDVLTALARGARTLHEVTAIVYGDIPPALLAAASRNALAHLVDLRGRGLVSAHPDPGEAAIFTLIKKDDKKTTEASGRS